MTPHYKMKEDMTRTRTKPFQNRHLTKTLCGPDKEYVILFVVVSSFYLITQNYYGKTLTLLHPMKPELDYNIKKGFDEMLSP